MCVLEMFGGYFFVLAQFFYDCGGTFLNINLLGKKNNYLAGKYFSSLALTLIYWHNSQIYSEFLDV